MKTTHLKYAVFSGSEKLDLGDKCAVALTSSQAQAEGLIKVLWPSFGYWQEICDPIELEFFHAGAITVSANDAISIPQPAFYRELKPHVP